MKQHTARSLMAETGGVGFSSRVFDPIGDGEERVEQFATFVDEIRSLKVSGTSLVKQVDVIIPRNVEQFPNLADCGATKDLLQKRIGSKHVRLHELSHGDMFCSMQNYAIAKQSNNCSWHITSSSETLPYWQGDAGQYIAEQLVEAACKGARVAGAAINPIAQSIMEGRIANTLAMWHGESLQAVGGFNLLAARHMNDGPGTRLLYGLKEDGEYLTTPMHGVEEMLPLAFMVREYGPCLAPFDVPFEGLSYAPPSDDERLKMWNSGKFDTKHPRQVALLAAGGFGSDFLANGVMDGYGWRK